MHVVAVKHARIRVQDVDRLALSTVPAVVRAFTAPPPQMDWVGPWGAVLASALGSAGLAVVAPTAHQLGKGEVVLEWSGDRKRLFVYEYVRTLRIVTVRQTMNGPVYDVAIDKGSPYSESLILRAWQWLIAVP